MKCALIDCDEEATAGWPCCSTLHGMMFRIVKFTLEKIHSPNVDDNTFSQWDWYIGDRPTVADAIYYSKFIKE